VLHLQLQGLTNLSHASPALQGAGSSKSGAICKQYEEPQNSTPSSAMATENRRQLEDSLPTFSSDDAK
jgi:hypothetical protein